MKEVEGKPFQWVAGTNAQAFTKMLRHKVDPLYERPCRLDVEAQKAICISKRCTCLFYEVGATIFHVKDKNFFHLSDGYNGASRGDVDPKFAGCARIVDGDLQEGKGYCRGSHAELNAIGNCPVDTTLYSDVRMMVTLHPCFPCAKQIVNRGIKNVYYIWEYGRDEHAVNYFKDMKVKVEKYTSPFLENWITVNRYNPAELKFNNDNQIASL
jgi:dCMP deaminase